MCRVGGSGRGLVGRCVWCLRGLCEVSSWRWDGSGIIPVSMRCARFGDWARRGIARLVFGFCCRVAYRRLAAGSWNVNGLCCAKSWGMGVLVPRKIGELVGVRHGFVGGCWLGWRIVRREVLVDTVSGVGNILSFVLLFIVGCPEWPPSGGMNLGRDERKSFPPRMVAPLGEIE